MIRTATFLISLLLCTQGAFAAWTHLPEKDAVSTPATGYEGPARPELVVVCNNMVRLTYVRWPHEFGIDRKMLPGHTNVRWSLTASVRNDTIWTIARPEKGATQYISHDVTLPVLLADSTTAAFDIEAAGKLPMLTARFELAGLQKALDQYGLACRPEDRFQLKMLRDKEAEEEQTKQRLEEVRQREKAKAKKEKERSFMPLPDPSMFDP